ncbi:GPALPP motifs-containing protein 1 isoform X1 [Python bivittatus]|uniref:GPALPP motifs-containing protein 1 n=2 Tax=Python bivittatus TaxID=176946 RepID=A0A9F5J5S9_PYTBI|nr:GPALPP motifs-containing protein 1 isoform X1 [Python bivittatus]
MILCGCDSSGKAQFHCCLRSSSISLNEDFLLSSIRFILNFMHAPTVCLLLLSVWRERAFGSWAILCFRGEGKRVPKNAHRPIIGPALPPGFKQPSEGAEENRCYITQMSDSSEEEEAVIGPMPARGSVESNPGAEIEDRARRMKERLLGHVDDGSKQAKRESWMTDLPPELKNFGLGPRTFKRRPDDKSGDRSVWTDTPADREKKANEQQEARKSISKDNAETFLSERDKRLAEQLSSYNESQRSESLMDIHRKKLKSKTAGEKNKPQERRPFDRDQDLQVHQFDEARKKAIIKQSRDLNTRFSHGKCNTFL